MVKTHIHEIMNGEKTLLLAMDQGLEHGPKDFNITTINPEYVLDIAVKGRYNGMILQKGIAQKYFENYRQKVPLILKLNGKTTIPDLDPYAAQLCSVKEAVKLGASAVGYTIFVGSPKEPEIFREFSKIQEEAHDFGIPVIAWMYPRGRFVPNDLDTDILAYSARIGQELGADFVKMKYNFDLPGYKWVVKCAGRTKVLVAGGEKTTIQKLLEEASQAMQSGAAGMAIGRNVWQSDNPLGVTEALKKVIFDGLKPEKAIKFLNTKPYTKSYIVKNK
jgi:class I fructose-bisphosphate aldolase